MTTRRLTDADRFRRRRRVRWLAPSVLARSVKPVLVSGLFAKFGDRREVEAVLDQGVIDLSTQPHLDALRRAKGPWGPKDPGPVAAADVFEEMWIDYVADTGDGFDATATVAHLVAQPTLEIPSVDGRETHATTAGSLLVFGGDEVYPFANRKEYINRFTGPWRAMLPHEEPGRIALALPGNHDWYDGLTAFLQVFCGRTWMGGWKMAQRRSYFACKLPQRWWLWAIDIQLETYVDHPQLEYFAKAADEIKEGDGIILCWAVPSWVKAGEEKHQAYETLEYFQRNIVPNHAHIRVSLTGDSHHYARYEGPDTEQKITAGIGGAFTSATQHLPPELHLPANEDGPPILFERRCEYPTCADSTAMRNRVLRDIYFNNGFTALPAVVYGAMAAAATRRGMAAQAGVGCVLVAGCVAFSKSKKPAQWIPGLAHGLTHLAAAGTVATVLQRTACRAGARPGWRAFAGGAVIGGVAGPAIFALYLIVADHKEVFRRNTNELYAAMAIEDHKGFLRLHIKRDGELRIYPIKVDKVARWERAGTWPEPAGAPRFRTKDGAEPKAELIEGPVDVCRVPKGTAR